MKTLLKKKKEIVNINVEKTDTRYSAHAESYPIYTTARTAAELLKNIKEALNFYLEDEGVYIIQGNSKFSIDFNLFFQHYKVLNANFLAERMGMSPILLSQYVQGRKAPLAKEANKILEGIHEIGRKLSPLNLVR